MADPKKEPQYVALLAEMKRFTKTDFKVNTRTYPHPTTGRKMTEFILCVGTLEVLTTKDYNRINENLIFLLKLLEAGYPE